ncbi:MAG: bifunctional metallophosphatase/5'-nucleotidase [Armatimonadetes bacterium]|nr:bifunctional metallophosphatase/5'-nucleotidase [Armatimonadota bacterium]
MLRRFLIPLAILLALATPLVADLQQQPTYLEFTLLSTNDLHGCVLPFNQGDKYKDQLPTLENVGGAARRATLIKQEREANPNGHVLLLDTGDLTFGWSPLVKFAKGAADIEVMNALGLVAMCPGNHEFEWPSKETLRNHKASNFPWLCANLVNEKTGKRFLEPYMIKEYSGVRVAFLGLITSLVNKDAYKGARELGLIQIDGIEEAKKIVPEIRQKADILIVLSHLGYTLDQELAKVPGIDVILGGHSHTRLAQPTMIQVAEPTSSYIGAVPVVQAYQWGSEMGKTKVIFKRNPETGAYTLMSCKGELLWIDENVPEDPAIAEIVNRYKVKMETKSSAIPALTPAVAIAR